MRRDAASAARLAGASRWWESSLVIALVLFASALPLLFLPIPPLVDLLGHMGRFKVELDLDSSAWLARYYSFHWAPVGNLGVDVLVRVLGPAMGVEAATKLVVLLIPPLTVAGYLAIAREAHGEIPPTAYFAVPFAYGQPMLYGFVNFTLSMALAMLAFALWLRLGRTGRQRLRAILFVPISLVIFFAHAIGWGVLGLACLGAELVRRRSERAPVRAALHAAIQVASLALPVGVMLAWHGDMHGPTAWAWFEWQAKLVWIESALRDRWALFDVGSIGIVLLLLIAGLRERGARFSMPLIAAALLLIAAFVLLPTTLFGSAYADRRLTPTILALLVLALRWPGVTARTASILACAALAFAGIRLGSNAVSLQWASTDLQNKSVALSRIPMGARVASFTGVACNGTWLLPRNTHLGAMVTIRRDGFSNDQWLMESANGLAVRYFQAGDFTGDPSEIVVPNGCEDQFHRPIDDALRTVPRDAFDYVWLIDSPAYDPRTTSGLDLEWKGAGAELYRIGR